MLHDQPLELRAYKGLNQMHEALSGILPNRGNAASVTWGTICRWSIWKRMPCCMSISCTCVCICVSEFLRSSVCFAQFKNREGEKRARPTAWNDPDWDQWSGDSRGDGKGAPFLSASDVWGQKRLNFIRESCYGAVIGTSCAVCASVSSIGLLQYLLKVNEIKIKKGVDLLQNLIKYFHAQCK